MEQSDNEPTKDYYQVTTLSRYIVISRNGIDSDIVKFGGVQVEYHDLNYRIYRTREEALKSLPSIQESLPFDNLYCLLNFKLEDGQVSNSNNILSIVKQVVPATIILEEMLS